MTDTFNVHTFVERVEPRQLDAAAISAAKGQLQQIGGEPITGVAIDRHSHPDGKYNFTSIVAQKQGGGEVVIDHDANGKVSVSNFNVDKRPTFTVHNRNGTGVWQGTDFTGAYQSSLSKPETDAIGQAAANALTQLGLSVPPARIPRPSLQP